jgi:hypothetical protein
LEPKLLSEAINFSRHPLEIEQRRLAEATQFPERINPPAPPAP